MVLRRKQQAQPNVEAQQPKQELDDNREAIVKQLKALKVNRESDDDYFDFESAELGQSQSRTITIVAEVHRHKERF